MYTIKEASARSGVGIPLLRAWERRYGVVTPVRTAAGYRLYDDAAIGRLLAMRRLIADGWSAQQAAERIAASSTADIDTLADAAPAADAEAHDDGALQPSLGETRAGELVASLVESARVIDTEALESSLDEAFSAARFEVVADRVIVPALRLIGDGWERGEIDVAGEHAASHAVLRRLAMAFEAAGGAMTDPPILVGLGPGTRHELGALTFAIAARRAGLPVLYLGPDLPVESWITAARTRSAVAAVIGVPTRADVRRATEVIDRIRAVDGDLVLAVGGDEAGRVVRPGVLLLPEAIAEAVGMLRTAITAQARVPSS
jgi:DNA-binding transcriptional MerR regulator